MFLCSRVEEEYWFFLLLFFWAVAEEITDVPDIEQNNNVGGDGIVDLSKSSSSTNAIHISWAPLSLCCAPPFPSYPPSDTDFLCTKFLRPFAVHQHWYILRYITGVHVSESALISISAVLSLYFCVFVCVRRCQASSFDLRIPLLVSTQQAEVLKIFMNTHTHIHAHTQSIKQAASSCRHARHEHIHTE